MKVLGKPCKYGHDGWRYASGHCVQCAIKRTCDWQKANQEKYSTRLRAYHLKNLGKRRLRDGLPLPTRPAPDSCEICGSLSNDLPKRLALDHCHKTDSFRGWLCTQCNLGLGNFRDSGEILTKALAYLNVNVNYSSGEIT